MYNGADDKNIYSTGWVLFDKKDPTKVLARAQSPFLLRGPNAKESDRYLMSCLWRDSFAMEDAGFFIMAERTRTWVWPLLRHADQYRHT